MEESDVNEVEDSNVVAKVTSADCVLILLGLLFACFVSLRTLSEWTYNFKYFDNFQTYYLILLTPIVFTVAFVYVWYKKIVDQDLEKYFAAFVALNLIIFFLVSAEPSYFGLAFGGFLALLGIVYVILCAILVCKIVLKLWKERSLL
jgi:hypothetical protein